MRIALLTLTACLAASPALADSVDELDQAERRRTVGGVKNGPFGIGVLLGEPTAFTAKYLFAPHSGVQMHVGYGIGKNGRFILIGDYLFHLRGVIPPFQRVGVLVPYIGVGGRLGVHTGDPIFGVRFPGGAGMWLSVLPIEIFLEFAVGVGLIPSTDVLFDAGAGARWYF